MKIYRTHTMNYIIWTSAKILPHEIIPTKFTKIFPLKHSLLYDIHGARLCMYLTKSEKTKYIPQNQIFSQFSNNIW